MIGSVFITKHHNYKILKLLGKGKSGFSYLAEKDDKEYVIKLIHNEEAPYYKFADKMLSEIDAYEQLLKADIRIPKLIEYHYEKKYLIKEYIYGLTGTELIARSEVSDSIFRQLFEIYKVLKTRDLNIDYFPSNFVLSENCIYYIDYEINKYKKEWDLENWGIYYWLNNKGMKDFIETGDASHINESIDKGIPYKKKFQAAAEEIIRKYSADS